MTEKPKRAKPDVAAAAKAQLAEFLANNPGSRIAAVAFPKQERAVVFDPWQDDSIALRFPDDPSAFCEAMNSVFLPPRYSAIYHRADRRLEVIWTAWKLDDDQAEVASREFVFELAKVTHKCWFGKSSAQLLEIAKHVVPLGISATDFRNLRSYQSYHKVTEEERKLRTFGEPVSFWIDNIDWDDDAVLNISRHINFFLRYYDTKSPIVKVHPRQPGFAINPRNRYFEGMGFPQKIVSPELDQSLLVLWNGSFTSSRASNFLNFYRIIEYVSYYYMHEDAKREVRDLIKQPHALSDVDRTSRDILLVLRSIKFQREQDAIVTLLKNIVHPRLLAREVFQNLDFFSKPTNFEGELSIEPLVTTKDVEDAFGRPGIERFASSIIKIRNALAHGKDSNSHKTILPTSYNFDLLEPWLQLVAVAAGEVVLFDATH